VGALSDSSCHVDLLAQAVPGERGLVYRDEGGERILTWDRIHRALAAEVGEPQGVRTIVFDLVVETGPPVRLCRFDSDPIEGAQEVARALVEYLGPERATGSIKSIASDGLPTRWFPDLESLTAANLELLT